MVDCRFIYLLKDVNRQIMEWGAGDEGAGGGDEARGSVQSIYCIFKNRTILFVSEHNRLIDHDYTMNRTQLFVSKHQSIDRSRLHCARVRNNTIITVKPSS